MTPDRPRRIPTPRCVAVVGRELAIAWDDGHESYYGFDELRRTCPCAPCRADAEAAAAEGPLRLARGPAPGEISIVRWGAVGSYAIQIVWSDGHGDGIFAFDWLRGACSCDACAPRLGSRPRETPSRLRHGPRGA